jgi:hypothetical protein
LKAVKEIIYTTGTCAELDLLMIQRFKGDVERWMKYPKTWVIYLDLPTGKKIISTLFSTDLSTELRKATFIECFNKLPDTSIKSIVYLCTFCTATIRNQTLFKPFDSGIELLKAITKYTFGRLVYEQQAVYLYMLIIKSSFSQAKEWVYKMKRMDKKTMEAANKIKITSIHSMLHVWINFTLSGDLYWPNYKGASIFYNFLKS